MPVFLGGANSELPPSLDVPGLDRLESSSGLSCMYSASCLGGKRVGGGSNESHARNIPAVASFEADVLCLHCCHCCVLALLAVASLQAPSPLRRPLSYPWNPKAKFASNCWRRTLAWVWDTCPQFARLPTSEGEGEHLAAEAWKCFSCCPGRPETSRRLCLIKVEKDAFLPARVCWGLPILHPPLQAQE